MSLPTTTSKEKPNLRFYKMGRKLKKLQLDVVQLTEIYNTLFFGNDEIQIFNAKSTAALYSISFKLSDMDKRVNGGEEVDIEKLDAYLEEEEGKLLEHSMAANKFFYKKYK